VVVRTVSPLLVPDFLTPFLREVDFFDFLVVCSWYKSKKEKRTAHGTDNKAGGAAAPTMVLKVQASATVPEDVGAEDDSARG